MNPLKLPNRKSSIDIKDIKDKDKHKLHDTQKKDERKKIEEKGEKINDHSREREKSVKKDDKASDVKSDKGDSKKPDSERKRSEKAYIYFCCCC